MDLRALIVDDSLVARLSMRKILAELGYATEQAESGEAALARLATGFRPSVVFLDLTMPGIGGIATLEAIARNYANLPVIVVTADIQSFSLDMAKAAGSAAIVRKPATKDEILASLESLRLAERIP